MRADTDRETFLGEAPATEAVTAAYDADREQDGYVWNKTRLWSWRPDVDSAFGALRTALMDSSTLTDREFAVLVTSTAGELGDSYCTLAWGPRLARLSDAAIAARVIAGADSAGLSEREAALAAWARAVVRDPNGTTAEDVDGLRAAGLDDREIFEATAFVALRLAFSTVNDALGAAPDQQLAAAAPEPVRAAVRFGRPPSREPSHG